MSLYCMGWRPSPTFVIHPDPTRDTPYPVPHAPPGSPHPGAEPMSPPEGQLITSTGISAQQGNDLREASHSASPTHMDTLTTPQGAHVKAENAQPLPVAPPTSTILTLLTINAQKAGANSPSLSDVVTMLDDHSPDILFLTETPLHTRSGALKHILRNRGYCIHYHGTTQRMHRPHRTPHRKPVFRHTSHTREVALG